MKGFKNSIITARHTPFSPAWSVYSEARLSWGYILLDILRHYTNLQNEWKNDLVNGLNEWINKYEKKYNEMKKWKMNEWTQSTSTTATNNEWRNEWEWINVSQTTINSKWKKNWMNYRMNKRKKEIKTVPTNEWTNEGMNTSGIEAWHKGKCG